MSHVLSSVQLPIRKQSEDCLRISSLNPCSHLRDKHKNKHEEGPDTYRKHARAKWTGNDHRVNLRMFTLDKQER